MRIILAVTLSLFIMTVSVSNGRLDVQGTPAFAADGMAQVQLILKKLRSSLVSLKDFDELEAAGMDKADVNRMRRAMEQKIKQMTGDAVTLIKAI